MRIENEIQLDFDDLLIRPKRSSVNSRKDVDVVRTFKKFKWYNKTLECIPVCSANMATTGTVELAKILSQNKLLCALHKFYSDVDIERSLTKEERSYCFKSVGINDALTLPEGMLGFNFDVPNGYIPKCIDKVKEIRQKFGNDIIIIAGTVVTSSMTEDLIIAGADIVRVGIGGGSACKTRLQTGCGRPQVSTIVECADAAHGVGGMIMSDGGIVHNGDLCKAFCLNSDFVMCGSMFAKAQESGGDLFWEWVEVFPITDSNGDVHFRTEHNEFIDLSSIKHGEMQSIGHKCYMKKFFKLFYGMSSRMAQEKFMGGMPCYRASEGREVLIECNKSTQEIIDEALGSLRSCGTYIGAQNLKEFGKRASFYRVSGKQQLNLSLVK